MRVYSHPNCPNPVCAEQNSGESFVDNTGYLPPSVAIPQMLRAGVLLDQARKSKGYYEYPANSDFESLPVDPTTRPDFDRVHAQELATSLQRRFDAAKADALIAKAKEAKNQSSAATEPPAVPVLSGPPVGLK